MSKSGFFYLFLLFLIIIFAYIKSAYYICYMIQEQVIKQIRKSKSCKLRLQVALDRSAPTIQRYLDDNDIMLTTSKALEVIKSEFKLTDKQIIIKN